jgi:hypothetical protein
VFAFYFVATIASFIAGTVADLQRGSSTRRLPLTLVAALLLALKLDDNTSHACLPRTPPPPIAFIITTASWWLICNTERRYGISWAIVFIAPFLLVLAFTLYVAFFYWLYVTTLRNNTASSN